MTDRPFSLEVPPQLVDAVAEKVAAILSDRENGNASPWLTRAEAADYLGVPVSRLEKDRTLPVHRWDGRVLYNRDELDAYLLSLGGSP